MDNDLIFYGLAIVAVVLTGLAKGGFAGVGQLATPLLALAVSPVRAAAILLPILVVQDAVGIYAFRKSWDGRILAIMLPGAVLGILGGYFFAAQVSMAAILAALGIVSIVFAGYQLARRRAITVAAPSNSPPAVGFICGMASGFTSQIAHAGIPPFQIWVLPKRLQPAVLVGTNAIFFGTVNWLKVPAYAALGQFTHENLRVALFLLPVAIASTFAGVWLVKRVSAEGFYTAIYLCMMAVGGQLIYEALTLA